LAVFSHYVWDSVIGMPLLRLAAKGRLTNWTPAGFADCLALAPDGRVLATGHADGTILLWDLAPAHKALAPASGDREPAACWEDLARENARAAYLAIDRLAQAPAAALLLLRDRLRPVAIDPRWLAERLADLDSSTFAVREAASRALAEVAEAVEPDLRQALEKTPSPEARRRLRHILEASRPAAVPPAAEVRRLRALAVLERIGSGEARATLRQLARGATGALLTREARAALGRLDRTRSGP
jgi:hypothetical protein